MKKMISLLLCLVMLFGCCFSALAYDETPVTFSIGKVSGKVGDIVLVDVSILEENTNIENILFRLEYDTKKLEFAPHPQSKEYEPVVSGSPGEMDVLYTEEYLQFYHPEGTQKAGVIFSIAFKLLEDLSEEQALVACDVISILPYNLDETISYVVSYQNRWEGATKINTIPVSFTLSNDGGKYDDTVCLYLNLDKGASGIRELQLQLVYDQTKLELLDIEEVRLEGSGLLMATLEPDLATSTVTLKAEDPDQLHFALPVAKLVFRVIASTPTDVPFEVGAVVTKPPVHRYLADVDFDITVHSGFVTYRYYELLYEKAENGVVITGCHGNDQSIIVIPHMIEGVPVVEIGENAFAEYSDFTKITIPASVTKIAENAFEECDSSLLIRCHEGGAADVLAQKKGLPVSYYVPAETVTGTDVLPLGDLYSDGMIDAKDALRALLIAVQKYYPVTPAELFVGDVNKDEKVNAKDAMEILKKAVKKPACF